MREIQYQRGGACRPQCGKQAGESPMRKGAPQAPAQRGDYSELWEEDYLIPAITLGEQPRKPLGKYGTYQVFC